MMVLLLITSLLAMYENILSEDEMVDYITKQTIGLNNLSNIDFSNVTRVKDLMKMKFKDDAQNQIFYHV